MERMIIVGSPRTNGRSAQLAEQLFDACIDECPEDGVSIASVASLEIAPCVGCDACKPLDGAKRASNGQDGPCESASCALPCAIDDDMAHIRESLDAADELIVVCPVYFSGAPAQMKALIDRLQPYYWMRREGEKRPMVVHVVGEGGDPHGFDPLIGTLRSAFACAGFELELVLDWVGKITEDGDIVAEADEYEFDDAFDESLDAHEPCCKAGDERSVASAQTSVSDAEGEQDFAACEEDDDYGDVTWNR